MPDGASAAEMRREHGEYSTAILRGTGWMAVGFGGNSALWMVALVILARQLTPADFGLVALATVFILFVDALFSSGIRSAFIRTELPLPQAVASTFVAANVAAIGFYVVLFAVATPLERGFAADGLADVLRALALMVPLRAVGMVPGALLERRLKFRRRAVVDLATGAVQLVVAVALAFSGAGVWSLVGGQLAGAAIFALLAWTVAPVALHLREARREAFRELADYGRFVSGGRVLELVSSFADNLVVGRMLGAAALGSYAVAFRLATFPTTTLAGIGNRVLLPALAAVRDDTPLFRRVWLENVHRVALVVVPVCVLLAVAGDALVRNVLGDKWQAAVSPLRFFAAYALLLAIAMVAVPVFEAVGRARLVFQLTLPSIVTVAPFVAAGAALWGITGAAAGMVASQATSAVPRAVLVVRFLGVRSFDLIRALAVPIVAGGILALALLAVGPLAEHLSPLPELSLILAGACIAYVTPLLVVGHVDSRTSSAAAD